MLTNIIAALVMALGIITSAKAREKALKDEIAARDVIIADQQAIIDSDSDDDEALEAAAEAAKVKQAEAEASLAEVNKRFVEADAKASELIAKINADNENPVNVSSDGTVSTVEGV